MLYGTPTKNRSLSVGWIIRCHKWYRRHPKQLYYIFKKYLNNFLCQICQELHLKTSKNSVIIDSLNNKIQLNSEKFWTKCTFLFLNKNDTSQDLNLRQQPRPISEYCELHFTLNNLTRHNLNKQEKLEACNNLETNKKIFMTSGIAIDILLPT